MANSLLGVYFISDLEQSFGEELYEPIAQDTTNEDTPRYIKQPHAAVAMYEIITL